MKLARERWEARRHAGIEYLLFWRLDDETSSKRMDPEVVLRSYPRSFLSIVTRCSLPENETAERIFSIVRFIFGELWWANDSILLVSRRMERMIDGGMMMRKGTIKSEQRMTGVILEIDEICVGTSELKNYVCKSDSLENLWNKF